MQTKKKQHEVKINGKSIPKVKYYVEVCEYNSPHYSIPCKSTVVCACYNKETAEWIKSLIEKAYPEYDYRFWHNCIKIRIEDDPFYLSDSYRDVKRCREYHETYHTGYDLSNLSVIF